MKQSNKLSGRDDVLRTSTLIRDSPVVSFMSLLASFVTLHVHIIRSTVSKKKARKPSRRMRRVFANTDDGKASNDFWSISGNCIYRRHVEPRVTPYVPREASFPIPLTYIDVTSATSTSLDVMLEKSIDDYCNVDGYREIVGYVDRSYKIHGIGWKKPPDGYTWSGERLTRKQTTSRPASLWPEIWKDMSEASKRNEKQQWAVERPKLDNARKLRGIHFMHPADEEFKETMKTCA